jgi:hypothetical protein
MAQLMARGRCALAMSDASSSKESNNTNKPQTPASVQVESTTSPPTGAPQSLTPWRLHLFVELSVCVEIEHCLLR